MFEGMCTCVQAKATWNYIKQNFLVSHISHDSEICFSNLTPVFSIFFASLSLSLALSHTPENITTNVYACSYRHQSPKWYAFQKPCEKTADIGTTVTFWLLIMYCLKQNCEKKWKCNILSASLWKLWFEEQNIIQQRLQSARSKQHIA